MIQERLEDLIKEGNELLINTKTKFNRLGEIKYIDEQSLSKWNTKTISFLKSSQKLNDYLSRFNEEYEYNNQMSEKKAVEASLGVLNGLLEDIKNGYIKFNEVPTKNVDEILDNLFNRFHSVSKQLKQRHSNRKTLEIEDEYDVQDLLHSLLKIYFDDIRPEEWTPSYAGGSSRMDFLIPEYDLVIEVKKTRGDLKDRQVGDQLIIDIDRYSIHPNCKTLICFVYDQNGLIKNSRGIENDLSKEHEDLLVKVIIRPIST